MTYAENTSVASDRSRAEIERTLTRYGAESFMYGWQDEKATIIFKMNNRMVKFTLPLPKKEDFGKTETGRKRRGTASKTKAWEQSTRQKWRALSLVVKAKLEAVESGITVFDDEFLAHIVMPNGQTTGQFMKPVIEKAYLSGKMPKQLPLLTD